MILIMILAIYSLSYFIRNLSGPFNIFDLIRNRLMRNEIIGVQIFKLLDCPYCLGFHCGYIIYFLQCDKIYFNLFLIWGLTGSAVVAILDRLLVDILPAQNRTL